MVIGERGSIAAGMKSNIKKKSSKSMPGHTWPAFDQNHPCNSNVIQLHTDSYIDQFFCFNHISTFGKLSTTNWSRYVKLGQCKRVLMKPHMLYILYLLRTHECILKYSDWNMQFRKCNKYFITGMKTNFHYETDTIYPVEWLCKSVLSSSRQTVTHIVWITEFF